MFVFHSYSEWCWERGWFLLVTTCERVEDKRVRDDDQKWICRSWMWKKEEWTNGALIEYERRSREFGKLRVENGTDGQMSDRCSQPCHPIDANFQATYWCQRLNDLSTFRPPRSNITLAIPRHNDFENNIIHSCSEEKRHWESHSHAFLSPYPADCRCSPHAKSQDDGQNLALYLLQLFEKWLTDILPAPQTSQWVLSIFYPKNNCCWIFSYFFCHHVLRIDNNFKSLSSCINSCWSLSITRPNLSFWHVSSDTQTTKWCN